VEAAGVEPASENVTGQETTCLVEFMPQALPWDVRGRRSEPTRNSASGYICALSPKCGTTGSHYGTM